MASDPLIHWKAGQLHRYINLNKTVSPVRLFLIDGTRQYRYPPLDSGYGYGYLPPLGPHLLNFLHRLLERELEQLPPPLASQILSPLASPHMELLEIRLATNTVHRAVDLEVSQRRSEINSAVRVHVDLTTQLRSELQLDATDRCAVLVLIAGFDDCAREGERVIGRGAACCGGLLGFSGLDECLACLSGVAAGDVQLAQHAVEFVHARIGRFV